MRRLKLVLELLTLVFALAGGYVGFAYFYYRGQDPGIQPRERAMAQLVGRVAKAMDEEGFKKGLLSSRLELRGPATDAELERVLPGELVGGLLAAPGKRFQLVRDPSEYRGWMKELPERLKAYGYGDETITEILLDVRSKAAAPKLPEYELLPEWAWVKGKEGKVLDLTVSVRYLGGKPSAPQAVRMYHPLYESRLRDEKGFMERAYIPACLTVMAACLAVFVPVLIYMNVKRASRDKRLDGLEARFEDYFKQGSFASARRLVEDEVAFLGESPRLSRLTDRLDATTHGDDKGAEQAAVRFKGLLAKWNACGGLDEEGSQELAAISKRLSLPEIEAAAGKAKVQLRQLALGREKEKARSEIAARLESGDLRGAQETLLSWEKGRPEGGPAPGQEGGGQLLLPSPDDIAGARARIEEQKSRAARALGEGLDALGRADVAEAEPKLREALQLDKGLDEARRTLERLSASRAALRMRLKPQVGKEVVLIRGTSCVKVFRPDKKKPDIPVPPEHKSVSRDAHLDLHVLGDQVVAENLGKAGTRHMGEPIEGKAEVSDGAVLRLGEDFELVAHIWRGGAGADETVLGGQRASGGAAPSPRSAPGPIGGVYLEAPRGGVDHVVLKEAVGLRLTAVGFSFDPRGAARVLVCGGVVLLELAGEKRVLCPGDVFEHKGIRCEVGEG